MTFGDPDLILTWYWPPMMSKILFLCMGAQKYTFWKFALDDLWWPWPDFDLPWGPNFFSGQRSSKIYFWKICTWWPLMTLTTPPLISNSWNYFGVVLLYCSKNSWNFEVSHDFYLQVDLWPCRFTCTYFQWPYYSFNYIGQWYLNTSSDTCPLC